MIDAIRPRAPKIAMPRNDFRKAEDDRLGRVLSYFVSIVAILGIPSGLYGYFASEHAKTVDKTFEFYRDFRSDSFKKDWTLLLNRWNEKADDVQKNLRNDTAILDLVSSLIKDKDGQAALSDVVVFFDALSTCIESALCDQNTAVALFKSPATEFAGVFGPYIFFVREKYKNVKYGSGIIKIRGLNSSPGLFPPRL